MKAVIAMWLLELGQSVGGTVKVELSKLRAVRIMELKFPSFVVMKNSTANGNLGTWGCIK